MIAMENARLVGELRARTDEIAAGTAISRRGLPPRSKSWAASGG